ncbi:metal-dependent transcriptional regulator [Fervidibacter sacchari]|uniref:DtxR family Mn-dependent transcriptional regulator n=1 Tax=Candidatus Fervidibacter sacchari TaxID=1448929 RepID=A0ABT2EIE8_9BACT|nr:iron dependent repressor, metal binding and dimerization domain protein [Candidatus Fervidibacter sacchari]MCS3917676.1 DtxR family Mn-dependent transcriptional regulator [Candidatus Fervidibacter sacchari]WKU15506.1 metal-dependent transcriptional regulator [Candidatus Fervidibacter sacchari]
MALSRDAEHILQLLWIKQHEKGNPPYLPMLEASVTEDALQELLRQGLIAKVNGEWQLTEKGEEVARIALRRRRLAERLLVDLLQTADNLLDETACSIEHILHEGLEEAICTLLGHPRFCPHGGEIPPGKCCEEARRTGIRLIVPLSEMKPNETGRIAYIQTRDTTVMQKLMAMGILPGETIRLVRRSPSFVFEVQHTQYAVDSDIADCIYVRLTTNQS